MRRVFALMIGLVGWIAVVALDCADARADDSPSRLPTWPDTLLEDFGLVPVQDGGRVKPLFSWARFQLLQIHGTSTYTPAKDTATDDARRSALTWVLDCLLYPELAKQQPLFRIQDEQTVFNLGMTKDTSKKKKDQKRKRDMWSYAELAPFRDELRSRAAKVQRLIRRHQEEKGKVRHADVSPVGWETIRLERSVELFERLVGTLDFAVTPINIATLREAGAWEGPNEGADVVPALEVARRLPDLWAAVRRERRLNPETQRPELTERGTELNTAMATLRLALDRAAGPPARTDSNRTQAIGKTDALHLLPPAVGWREQWIGIGSLLRRASFGGALDPLTWPQEEELRKEYATYHAQLIEQVEHLAAARVARDDPALVAQHLQAFKEETVRGATAIDAYEHIPLEVRFYKMEPFYYGLLAYIAAFVLLAFTWLFPRGVWLIRAVWLAIGVGALFHITGIVMRCIIRQRPPVLTLYDTILFIGACAVLACAIIEWINRKRIAIVLAALLGAGSLWLASTYEVFKAEDTIAPLVAVLDTNFWLSTHVTTVTLGYAAGLLAAAIGHVYLLGKIFGFRRNDPGFYRTVTKMTYGVICFGLLFSVIGTILGGIWANDSWGRFWGWDPKENGALMICLWELAILHARMGGLIRAHGVAMAAVATGPIVAFSWWGVNLLEIGLHSYGFTSEVGSKLSLYYRLEVAVLLGGLAWWLLNRGRKPGAPAPSASS